MPRKYSLRLEKGMEMGNNMNKEMNKNCFPWQPLAHLQGFILFSSNAVICIVKQEAICRLKNE